MWGVSSRMMRWRCCCYYYCLLCWILLMTFCHGLPVTSPTTRGGIAGEDEGAGDVFITGTTPTAQKDYESPFTTPKAQSDTNTEPQIYADETGSTIETHYETPSTDEGWKRTKKPARNTGGKGTEKNTSVSHQEAMAYLVRYNYLAAVPSNVNKTGSLYRQNELHSAIEHFQWFMGLNQTGVLDEPTQEMMSRPRCGVPDVEDPKLGQSSHKRGRRYTDSGYRWSKTDLTYKITWYSSDLTNRQIRKEIEEAFKLWSEVTPLTFTRVTRADLPHDIDIQFRTYSHGDGIPFDGPGKILAHAFYPPFGDVHFDDDENWTATHGSGINLRLSAAHELGHALGLGHSNDGDSLMAPTYDYSANSIDLYPDDIYGIQSIYGGGDGNPGDRLYCVDASVDASTSVGSTTYIFKDADVYKIDGNDGMASGFPRPLSDLWHALPERMDAALHTQIGSHYYNYYFKGHRVWRYEGYLINAGWNGVEISDKIEGLPDYIDSIHRYPRNGRAYAMKGNQYYRMKRDMTGIDDGYPKDLSIWWKKSGSMSMDRIDGAIDWPGNRNRVYFFLGGQYWRYNTDSEKLDRGYPRSTAEWWYGCADPLTRSLRGEALRLQQGPEELRQEAEELDYGTLGPSFDVVIPPNSAANHPSVLQPVCLLIVVIISFAL